MRPISAPSTCWSTTSASSSRWTFDETTEENWDRNVDINLKGVFFLIQAVTPQMRRRGGGRIVNITSIAGSQGFTTAQAYCAAKRRLLNLTRALALAPDRINVNAVAPGFIRTQMTEHQWQDEAFIAGLGRMLATRGGYMEPEGRCRGGALPLLRRCRPHPRYQSGRGRWLARRPLGDRLFLTPGHPRSDETETTRTAR